MKNLLGKAAAASVGVVLLKVLVGGSVLVWGAHTLTVGAIDAGLVAALLAPTLGAFVTSLHHRFDDPDEEVPKPKE